MDTAKSYADDVFNKLNGTDFRILDWLRYLSKQTAKKSPSGAKYCYASQERLSQLVKCSREYLSRRLCFLSKLGVISITHRRMVNGVYQTNFYKIVNWRGWAWGSILAKVKKAGVSLVTNRSQKAYRNIDGNTRKEGKDTFTHRGVSTLTRIGNHPIIQAWLNRANISS